MSDVFFTKQLYDRAKAGDPLSMNNLGICYYFGENLGVEQDYDRAFKLFTLDSSLNNYAPAICNMGYCQMFGDGVPEDKYMAFDSFIQAAKLGLARAFYELSNCYSSGDGVKQDSQKALKWLRVAANLGSASAQVIIGNRFYDGRGETQSYREAYKWYLLACNNCSADLLKNYLRHLDKTERELTRSIIDQVKEEVEEFQDSINQANEEVGIAGQTVGYVSGAW